MIIVAGSLRMAPEKVAAILPALTAMVAATRAEPGCVAYHLTPDQTEPGLVRVFEIFADGAALKAHGASAHMKAWRAATGDFIRDLTFYDATERADS